MFDWLSDIADALSVVYEWVKTFFSNKLTVFLLAKAIFFYALYLFMPWLLGGFYRWIYSLVGSLNLGIDFSFLDSLTAPQFTGIVAWLFLTLKLDQVFRILITAAVARLSIKALPLIGS